MFLGQYNKLTINRFAPPGAYLVNDEDDEILLPNKYVKEDFEIGDELEVFVYKDHEERLVAVTDKPLIELYGFAYLRCTDVNHNGAFVDWGMEKQLMIPYAEQITKMEEGKHYVVYLGIDDATQRLYGSTKVQKYLDNDHILIENGQEVDLLVAGYSDLGCKVIINDTYEGLIFKNQIIKHLAIGTYTKGFVKFIRPDGKIDVVLERQGRQKVEDHGGQILEYLKQNNGVSKVTEKSSPEEIRAVYGMSKKTFKQVLGDLYKQRKILLSDTEIKLTN
ncbi:MAG TPA: S1-like domain-containing RNA-binding protein [Crocinitomicaceae bacterium]|nr:S1-like domain-containing RNA-binding protein [Crocinitomicaceae bacterium]